MDRSGAGLVALAAALEAIRVLQHGVDLRRWLVELGQGDDHLGRLPVADLQRHQVGGGLETLDLDRESVELLRLIAIGVAPDDDRDDLVLGGFGTGEVRNPDLAEPDRGITLLLSRRARSVLVMPLLRSNCVGAQMAEYATDLTTPV